MNEIDKTTISAKLAKLNQVKQETAKVIVGQTDVIDQILISILAGGHCLIEGVPGLAKTLMVNTIAQTMDLDFHRVQFTPDLMPSDIVGTEILEEDHSTGKRFFEFKRGPVFTNILLADEINRTPPKTQAALLEAMQEKKVSYGGTTYDLPNPFFVLATQNPVEQSGTYPLPEAQLDRFLMFIKVNYPTEDEEVEILKRTTGSFKTSLNALLNDKTVTELQSITRDVTISESLLLYITRLVRATRPNETEVDFIKKFVQWGSGPRAAQAITLCAKANALLNGRFAVVEDDISAVIHATLRHRILLNFNAEAEKITCDQVVDRILEQIKLPASKLD